ncbi:BBP7 family outer membrane beta-barrel protein [Rubripirellula tenax]|uniref:BBP7 family outer membrane beta-barrel protein n=1 Tax=Rubripirellula tenax TaxID=2528015 RepID=UPI001FEC9576|nr:BBP7 family outer membrane beta-barrel protein [Rubripirellula tenax]
MSPRRSIVVALWLICVHSLIASHVFAQGNYLGPGPVVVNNSFTSSGDPYASNLAQASQWLPSGEAIFGRPNFSTPNLGGYLPGPMTIADRLWVRTEYLQWWTEGMDVPSLVTTGPATSARTQAGVLGQPGTNTLFGGGEINGDSSPGIRFRSGFWLTPQATFAIEGEYFQLLGNQSDDYRGSGNGSSVLARPFFDVSRGFDTAQLISFRDTASGSIAIDSDTDFKSFLINGRAGLCPTGICNANGETDRIDWIIGYRYMKLDDRLGFNERITSLIPTAPGTIAINESFRTSNEFRGLQLGVVHQANFKRAWLESLLRVAVGNNKRSTDIRGRTAITENGVTENYNGGLLAQRTNIGNFEQDEFTMIPEVGFTLGIRLTDWLDATVGYTMVYFPNVVRAGDQIDTDVNSNLFPPEDPAVTDGLRPLFKPVESQYWAHGLNLGAELRF